VRIATWNLDVHARPAKVELLLSLDADVLLLTEVPSGLVLPGYHLTPPGPTMLRGQGWAAVASRRPLQSMPSPHVASTVASVDGVTYVSSVLPWKGAPQRPWDGATTGERMAAAVDVIEPFLRAQEQLVWGGDWNQTMTGALDGSTRAGRDRLDQALDRLGLALPTGKLPRGAFPMATIDHIALPDTGATAVHVPVDRRLSDHDAYVVTTA
jgi:hypothetical protein